MKRFYGLAIFFSGLITAAQTQYEANWESLDKRPLPTWFADAKFGIFIHWGLYSVPAWGPVDRDFKTDAGTDWHRRVGMKYAEWYWERINSPKHKDTDFGYDVFREHHRKKYGADFKYADFVNGFTAKNFNPTQWADVFKRSGAKYIMLTSKHHEGFALWPSKYSWNWNAVDVGPHRDLLGDLTKAVKAAGIKIGYYYSLYEWFNPLYKLETLHEYIDGHMLPQMKELVTNYKPDVLWGDGQWDQTSATWKMPQFMAWLYNESPVKDSILINDRWGKDTWGEHGGYLTVEYGNLKDKPAILSTIAKPWEEIRGMGSSFGYNKNENLEDYSSSEALVHDLISKVTKGGNLLLNIGPTADGDIPVIMQQRLLDIGSWLAMNGEGIYGTRKWDEAAKASSDSTVSFTRKGADVFVILTKFPAKPVVISGVQKPKATTLLGWNGNVSSTFAGGKLTIAPPAVTPASYGGKYAWVFKVEGALGQ